MRCMADQNPGLSPLALLPSLGPSMPPGSLGLTGQVGEPSPGAFADLVTVPFSGSTRRAAIPSCNMPVPLSP